jgi:hypothetical protein
MIQFAVDPKSNTELEYVYLVVAAIGFIGYMCLIVGSRKGKRWLYVPYLIFEVRIN